MVSSIPLLGPAIDAIVARRSSKKMKSKRGVVVVNQSSVSNRSKRKARAGGRITGRAGVSVRDNALLANPIPISMNYGAGSTVWKFAGRPQAVADYDADRGIRVAGSSLGVSIFTTNSGSSVLFNTAGAYLIGPGELDPRLKNLAACFNYYAIRECRVTYVPALAAGGAGAVGNAAAQQLGVGILDNPLIFAEVTNTGQVLECDPSMLVQSTGAQSMLYQHSGTRLWDVDITGESDNTETKQFVFVGYSIANSTAANQNYGYLFYNYVIDLYGPSIGQTNIGTSVVKEAPVKRDESKDEKFPDPPLLKREVGFHTVIKPKSYSEAVSAPLSLSVDIPSPTKSLLAAELRSLRSRHFDEKEDLRKTKAT
jgi:hypothetical protein